MPINFPGKKISFKMYLALFLKLKQKQKYEFTVKHME